MHKSLTLLSLLVAAPALAAQQGLLVVMPLERTKVEAPVAATLEEAIRTISADTLAPARVTVLTKENTLQILTTRGADMEKLGEASGVIESARAMGAQLVVAGSISRVDGQFVAFIRLFESLNSRQIASVSLEGTAIKDLRRAFEKEAPDFFASTGLPVKRPGDDKQSHALDTLPDVARATDAVLPAKASVLVLDVKGLADADAKSAKVATDAIAHAVKEKRADAAVTSGNDIRAMVETKALQQLAGCEDEACVVGLGDAVKADFVISARIGSMDDRQLLYVSLIDTDKGVVRARSSATWSTKGSAIAGEVNGAVARLLAEGALVDEAAGPLAEQRIAVAFDELDNAGKSITVRLLEPCISKLLLDSNARLVSPEQAARLRKQVDVRALLAGEPLDALGTEDADLLLTGVVQYAAGAVMMGFQSQSVDANLQLVQLDTGEVVVAEQATGNGPGAAPQNAMRIAAQRACETLKPAITTALAKKRERGLRIVLNLEGKFAADRPVALAMAIGKLPRVRTSRVRKVGPVGSVIDVVVTGGDGVLLAMEMKRGKLPGRVVEAGPAALRVVP